MIALAKQKPKQQPLIFTLQGERKPIKFACPCPHEFKRPAPKVNRPIPKKVSDKKKNQQPVNPKSAATDNQRTYGSGEIQDLIRKYSQLYGINADTPLCIAKKESGFNPLSANKHSSARGVFQWLASSWKEQPEGKLGISVFDAEANVRAAVRYMAEKKSTKPWVVNSQCPPVNSL